MSDLVEIEQPRGSVGFGRRKHPGRLIAASPERQQQWEAVKLWSRHGDVWIAEDEGGWEWTSAIQWYEMPKLQPEV